MRLGVDDGAGDESFEDRGRSVAHADSSYRCCCFGRRGRRTSSA